jgi:hypothetical protein
VHGRKAEQGRRGFCIEQRIESACDRGFVLWPLHRRPPVEIGIPAISSPIIAET